MSWLDGTVEGFRTGIGGFFGQRNDYSRANGVVVGTYGNATHVGTITVTQNGTITNASNVAIGGGVPGGPAGGDLAGSYPDPTLALTGVVAGTYGSGGQNPQITVDAGGRIDGAANVASTPAPGGPAGGDLANTYPNPTLAVVGAATGPIGSSSTTPVITIDTKGRVTALSSAAITGITPSGAAGGDFTGTYANPTLAAIVAAAGPFGSITTTPSLTIDVKGRVTALTSNTIANRTWVTFTVNSVWVAPAGVTKVIIWGCGAGGAGGGGGGGAGSTAGNAGGGGGAGGNGGSAFLFPQFIPVTPGKSYNADVGNSIGGFRGSGGAIGGGAGSNGSAGSSTTNASFHGVSEGFYFWGVAASGAGGAGGTTVGGGAGGAGGKGYFDMPGGSGGNGGNPGIAGSAGSGATLIMYRAGGTGGVGGTSGVNAGGGGGGGSAPVVGIGSATLNGAAGGAGNVGAGSTGANAAAPTNYGEGGRGGGGGGGGGRNFGAGAAGGSGGNGAPGNPGILILLY